MPRHRPRAQLLRHLAALMEIRTDASDARLLLDDEDSVESLLDLHYESMFSLVQRSRYLFGRNHRERCNFDLGDCLSETSNQFNDEEFLFHFRCTRSQFNKLHKLICNHDIFRVREGEEEELVHGKVARPSQMQLLVFLFRVGKTGTGANSISVSSFFSIGKGTVDRYVNNCVTAINSFRDEYIKWPSEEERIDIKKRIGVEFGFRDCVGFIDGTLIFLDKCPQNFGESYFCRKSDYALTFLIVCDDERNITYFFGGHPGSAHDNRLWKECRMYNQSGDYFGHNEYLIGDAAFSKSNVMVATFKKSRGDAAMSSEKEFFNTMIGSCRVISEHTIGILKCRFPALKKLNVFIRTRNDVKRACEIVSACIVTHNLFNRQNTNPIPQEWFDEIERETEWMEDTAQTLRTHSDVRYTHYNRRQDAAFNGLGNNGRNRRIGENEGGGGEEEQDRREAVFDEIINEFY